MKRISKLLVLSLLSIVFIPGSTFAENLDRDQSSTRDREQRQDRQIYGYQLMTPEERNEYRARMRAASSMEEQEIIRREHHASMQERARERGVTLPPEPRRPAPAMGGPRGDNQTPGQGSRQRPAQRDGRRR